MLKFLSNTMHEIRTYGILNLICRLPVKEVSFLCHATCSHPTRCVTSPKTAAEETPANYNPSLFNCQFEF